MVADVGVQWQVSNGQTVTKTVTITWTIPANFKSHLKEQELK